MEKNNLDIQEVWKKYKRTKLKKYRDILIKHYYPMVKIVAEKLHGCLPSSVDINDLISAGAFGLIDAIDQFDLKRGVKFETFCIRRIRGAMLDELRELDWVPRLVRTKAHQLERVRIQLKNKLGRPPTEFETAQALKLSLVEYSKLAKEATPMAILSFNSKSSLEEGTNESVEAINLIPDKSANHLFKKLFYQDILNYLKNNLSKKERMILELYFYDELTMKEIGKILGISESRVSQLFNSLMTQLYRRFKRFKAEWLD